MSTTRGVAAPTTPRQVVELFLSCLATADLDGAVALLAPRVEYVNVGLPTVRGARRVRALFAWLQRRGMRFEVCVHAISADGGTVLTERTDALIIGRLRQQFWVTGRFDVADGRIVLWRDAFDFVDIVRSAVRGLAGAAVPSWQPRMPAPDEAPGR